VERVAFVEGQDVQQGDVLFVIDQRRYRADHDKALADLARARSEARLAVSQDVRAKSLIEARAISREEYDARQAATSQAKAAVQAAEAALSRTRLDLDYTEVRAPISGRAGRALVTVGNLAQADITSLTTLVSLDPVHVYFEGDEQAYLRLNRESGGAATKSGAAVQVALADESGYPHLATLDFIDNRLDPRTATIRARAVLPNPDRAFTPGLFARVRLAGVQDGKTVLVDEKAVLTDQDRKYVFVVGQENTAQRRDVVLGRKADGLRVVESGLAPGDWVIVQGVQKVFFPGMPVTPHPVAIDDPSTATAASNGGPAGSR
jgi:multidrug efflux system membrane fusion protein